MRWICLILSLCFAASAQQTIYAPFTKFASASGPTIAQQLMPGLAEYWEFTQLTTNATVTNWIGLLQGTILTNGATARQPTNSASGVGFKPAASVGFTNVPFNMGTNYIAVVFAQSAVDGGAFEACLMPLIGPYGNLTATPVLGINFDASGRTTQLWRQPNGSTGANSAQNFAINKMYDLVYCVSNNASPADSKILYYTNSVSNGNGGGSTSVTGATNYLSGVGYLNMSCGPSDYFSGFIQGIYILTNWQTSSAQSMLTIASNIHYYRTNFLTKGASP